jgi:hypothetical protein
MMYQKERLTKLELIAIKVPQEIILILVPKFLYILPVQNSKVTHDQVKENLLLLRVMTLHKTAKTLRILHAVVGSNHAIGMLIVWMGFMRSTRGNRRDRQHHGSADRWTTVHLQMPSLSLPPHQSELQADLDRWSVGELTDCVVLMVRHVQIVEVHHVEMAKQHGGNDVGRLFSTRLDAWGRGLHLWSKVMVRLRLLSVSRMATAR